MLRATLACLHLLVLFGSIMVSLRPAQVIVGSRSLRVTLWVACLSICLGWLGWIPSQRILAQQAPAAEPTIAPGEGLTKPGLGDREALQFFETHVRPILIDHCLECHSEETEASGGLLLDRRAGWERGGDSGPAIVPGDAAASLLILAIAYEDPHLEMPPEGKLSDEAIGWLKEWITQGAFDPRTQPAAKKPTTGLTLERAKEHWAYQPFHLHPVPSVAASSWIDSWIDAALEKQPLIRSQPVPRAALLRRWMADLHGLIPTPEEIEAFEGDRNPDALERMVDQLLASPRYGERMARRWMDTVRFGESLTLRGFVFPDAWRYRDYCIEAFQSDLAWDQFLTEQIAGDLIETEDWRKQQRGSIAAMFWLLGNTNLEEQDKKQLDLDVIDEQLDVFGRAVLGQTLGCARCHDHKFDPIPTSDYYAMAGILNGSQVLEHANVSKWIESPLAVSDAMQRERQQLESERVSLQEQIQSIDAKLKPQQGSVPVDRLAGVVVDDAAAKRVGDWKPSSSVQPFVGSGYLHDGNSNRGSKTITFQPPSLAPGRYEVRLSYTHGDNRATNAMVEVFSADGQQEHRIDQKKAAPIGGLWVSLGTYRFEQDGQAYVIVSNVGADGHVIADAVQFLPESASDGSAGQVAAKGPEGDVKQNQSLQQTREQLQKQLKKLDQQLASFPRAMVLKPRPDAGDLTVMIRGSVHQPGPKVPRGFLRAVRWQSDHQPDVEEASIDRIDLARWVTDPRHPLTARVAANRIFSWVMGEGLVRTVDEFGTTGSPPTHPELLDSLAYRWVREGWSTKRLVRELVLSDAYARRSDLPEGRSQTQVDPENLWLARGAQKRLDAETLRDSLLRISGQLDLMMFGKRFPGQLEADYGFQSDSTARSVYLPAFRNAPSDFLLAFDLADPSSVVGQRSRTVIPQQALTLLHHPWVIEQSELAADRLLKQASESGQVVSLAYRTVLGRDPSDEELVVAKRFLGAAGDVSLDRQRLALLLQSLWASMEFRLLK
ncbi:MAG: DUF1553 domain-containing protein [Pirellulaceae bacterium]